ncbi:MAG: FG-GAP-like repeat-containing protein [Pseudomonadota bacterium]
MIFNHFNRRWVVLAAIAAFSLFLFQRPLGATFMILADGDPWIKEGGSGPGGPPHRKCSIDFWEFGDDFGCKPTELPQEWDPDGRCRAGDPGCIGYGTPIRPTGGGQTWDASDPLTGSPVAIPVPWGFGGGVEGVDPRGGGYGSAIAIDVPPYHGLEPRISLGYSSGAQNGFVGVGWGLSGLSVLTAFSGGGSYLQLDGTDRFFLDGTEIFSCVTAHDATPGCDPAYGDPSAIKYFSKVEGFQRIEFRPNAYRSGGTWKVTQPDGTRVTYGQLFKYDQGFGQTSGLTVTSYVYRWAVQKIEDLHGNHVDFVWAFDPGSTFYGDFYPDSIGYNGNEIRFYRETRPDVVLRATGGVIPTETAFRLKAVAVYVGGSLRSLHRVDYTMSATNRSRVQDVKVFGTNAHVTASGDVDNGAVSLPLATYTYTDPSPSLGGAITTGVSGKFCSPPSYNATTPISNMWDSLNHTLYTTIGSPDLDPALVPADLNNDGCMDFLVEEYRGGVNEVRAYLSNCDGTFGSAITTALSGGHTPISLGDFNGDGILDFFYLTSYSGTTSYHAAITLYLGDGTGHFNYFTATSTAKLPVREIPPREFNGVGIKYWDPSAWTWKNITNHLSIDSYVRARATKLRVADMNGDGCDDIVSFNGCEYIGDADCGARTMTVYFSKCTDSSGAFQGFDLGSGTTAQGDSKGVATNVKLFIHGMNRPLSADGGTISDYIGHAGYLLGDVLRCQFADFNNDGRPDVYCIEPSSSGYGYGYMAVFLSEGNTGTRFLLNSNAGPYIFSNNYYGYFVARTGDQYPYSMMMRPADVNGDGFTDIIVFPAATAHSAASQVFLNLGNGRFGGPYTGPDQDFSEWVTAYNLRLPQFGRIPTSDWDGDGKADYGQFDPASKTFHMNLSSGRTLPGPSMRQPTCFFPGDYNGDGQVDLAVAKDFGDFTGPVTVYPTDSGVPDLLTQVRNGIGGTETIEYERRTDLVHEDRSFGAKNVPIPMLIVKSVTKSSGSQVIRTAYDFEGAKIDRSDPDGARFLGFASMRKTIPHAYGQIQDVVTKSYFDQDPNGSKLWKTESYLDNSGLVGPMLSRTTRTYDLPAKNFPYLVNLSQTDYEAYEPSCTLVGGYRICTGSTLVSHKRTRYPDHDAYGNVTRAIEDGDISVSGDEFTSARTFVSNLDKFMLRVPSTARVYAGTDTSRDNLIAETLFYTDNQTDPSAPPKDFGQVTRVDRLICTDCLVSFSQRLVSTLMMAFKMPVDDPVGGGNPSYATVEMGYDNFGNLLWSQDALGYRTTRQYDVTYNLFPVSTTNALNQATVTGWDYVCGFPTSVTNANLKTSRTYLDNYCRSVRSEGPEGNYRRTAYCDATPEGCGDPSVQHVTMYGPKASGSGELSAKSYFDGLGRGYKTEQEAETSGQTVLVKTQFDGQGNPYRVSYPYASDSSPDKWVETHVDPLGRTIETILPDGSSSTAQYSGFTVTSTDPAGRKKRTTVDTLGRTTLIERMTDGVFKTVQSFTYDAAGNLASLTDASGAREIYTYDLLGRLQAVQSPHIGTRTVTYDADGRLLNLRDAKGQNTSFVYDALGRATRRTIRDENGRAVSYSYFYDQVRPGFSNIGGLTTSTGPSENNLFNYDAGGRLVSATRIIDGIAYGFQWWYDADGRVLAQKYPDNDYVGTPENPMTYDIYGRLKTIPDYVSNAIYDPVDGSLTELDYANGEKILYQYDPARKWLTQIETRDSSGTPTERLSYQSFDPVGKLLSMQTLSGAQWTYQYDELDDLTRVVFNDPAAPSRSFEQTLDYELNGNLKCNSGFSSNSRLCRTASNQPTGSRNYFYDALKPHAVSTITGGLLPDMSFDYDANGNMKQRNTGQSTAILWNSAARPVSIGNTRFVYDTRNTRLKKIAPSGAVTLFLGYGAQIFGGTFEKEVYFGGTPVARKRNTTTGWLHTDRTGSVYRVANDRGQERWRRDYRPYGGEIASAQADQTDSNRRFTNAWADDETGLMFMNARYYDPLTGKFVSPDPVRSTSFAQGSNVYQYAANDPVNKKDVSGLTPDFVYRQSEYSIDGNVLYRGFSLDTYMGDSAWSHRRACQICGGVSVEVSATRPPVQTDPPALRGSSGNGASVGGGGGSPGTGLQAMDVPPPPKPGVVAQADLPEMDLSQGYNFGLSMVDMWIGSKAGGNLAEMARGMLYNLALDDAMRAYTAADHTAVHTGPQGANDFQVAGAAIMNVAGPVVGWVKQHVYAAASGGGQEVRVSGRGDPSVGGAKVTGIIGSGISASVGIAAVETGGGVLLSEGEKVPVWHSALVVGEGLVVKFGNERPLEGPDVGTSLYYVGVGKGVHAPGIYPVIAAADATTGFQWRVPDGANNWPSDQDLINGAAGDQRFWNSWGPP